MIAFLIRRLLYAVPTLLGVVLLTFILFFIVNTPEDMARRTLGPKAKPEAIKAWVSAHGYDKPGFYNRNRTGVQRFTDTLFFQKCARVMMFDLGRSDANDREIAPELWRRMGPSLAVQVPTFILELMVCITVALVLALCRGTYLDRWGTVVCVLMMSISTLFYIIAGQFIFAKWLKLFPISGFDWREPMWRFVMLPVAVGVIAGIGAQARFYRTVMLEEIGKDYVRTARAKGVSERLVLFRHVLKNAMIPILTNTVMVIPFLFLGSLLMESFFAIPGLGSMTIDAIQAQDFAVIRSITFLGAILYIAALIVTDISYTLVDPRIKLGSQEARTIGRRAEAKDAIKILAGLIVLGAIAAGIGMGLNWASTVQTRIPIVPNLILAVVLVGMALFIFHARGSALWRDAWRQLRANRLAMISLAVIAVFLLIAVLDSITWSDIERENKDGTVVYAVPRTLLDRICSNLQSREEKTFSAPMAKTLFVREIVEKEANGKIATRLDYPVLQYPGAHPLGTDKTGRDVLYVSLKSVRTGLVVGGLTTLIAVPFAIFFGVLAGFFGGWIDDVVVYLYTTLLSIPWVLLVVCFMLVFEQGLPQLCVALGLTGWVSLCRLLRGETLKLRERDYVQAALAMGASNLRVLWRHILPNVAHLILITVVLSFSGLVLAEAVLSYIGVGVGPDTFSWGSMINQARNELARDPIVWWNLAAAFIAMFALVLPANLFGDALRDALDPTLRAGH